MSLEMDLQWKAARIALQACGELGFSLSHGCEFPGLFRVRSNRLEDDKK